MRELTVLRTLTSEDNNSRTVVFAMKGVDCIWPNRAE